MSDSAGTPSTLILITGGSGFIGSQLAQFAARAGHDVSVVCAINNDVERQRHETLLKAGVRVTVVSLDDIGALASCVRDQDAIIHLAAAQHEAEAPESHFHRVNVAGTR